jgi:hypothetical protein
VDDEFRVFTEEEVKVLSDADEEARNPKIANVSYV